MKRKDRSNEEKKQKGGNKTKEDLRSVLDRMKKQKESPGEKSKLLVINVYLTKLYLQKYCL